MEFSIQLNHTIAKEAKIKKEIWSVEDCKKYVEKNSHLPNSQKGISLHKLLQKSKFIVEEKKEPVSEEFQKHMEYLRLRQSQREYAELVKGLQKKDNSLHFREVLDNPMDSVRNVVGMAMAAITMGFSVYYLMKRSYPPQIAIPIGILVFALMFILEVVLMMARFYLSEHPAPNTDILKKEKKE